MLGAALGLRVWGVKQGLPFAYNADENAHFVPNAIGLFGHGWNPHYFVNPPAYTYLLHVVFDVWFGGRAGVSHALATNPTEVFVVARVDRRGASARSRCGCCTWPAPSSSAARVGLLAAALLAVAFLPSSTRTWRSTTCRRWRRSRLSLWGTAGVLREGRLRDYAAGRRRARAGVRDEVHRRDRAAAAAWRPARSSLAAPAGRTRRARGLVLAGVVALGAFVVANPYAVLDLAAFRDGLQHQADAADDALGKLGPDPELRAPLLPVDVHLGAGLGAAAWPASSASACSRVDDRRALLVLGPAPILYVLYMGTQARFFGRWLLPVFPIACLLAAYAVVRLAAARRRGARRALAPALAVAGRRRCCCGQGIVYSLHSGDDALARRHAQPGARLAGRPRAGATRRIVVEPVVPDAWAQRHRAPVPRHRQRRALVEVPDQPLEHRQRRLGRSRAPGGS